MSRWLRFATQIVAYAGFATVLGYFSIAPGYEYASSEAAVIKLSMSHATERVEPCVQLTPQEIAELAPNMRRSEVCERERLPLTLELELDGVLLVQLESAPSGVWSDGAASVYERLEVAPGEHRIITRLRDTARDEGWDYIHAQSVVLEAGRYTTITFRPETGGFAIR